MDRPQRPAEGEDSSVDAQMISGWVLEWFRFQISQLLHKCKPGREKINPKLFDGTCLTAHRIGTQNTNAYRKIHISHPCMWNLHLWHQFDRKEMGGLVGLPHTRISQLLASSLICATFTTCGGAKVRTSRTGGGGSTTWSWYGEQGLRQVQAPKK